MRIKLCAYLEKSDPLSPQCRAAWCSFIFPCSLSFQFFVYRTYLICFRFARGTMLLPKYLSQRIVPRGGGIYMALDISLAKGGTLESLSFLRLPHQTNEERGDPRAVEGGMFFCGAADSSLTQSSRALTPVKIFVTIVLEPLWYLCSSFCLPQNRRKSARL